MQSKATQCAQKQLKVAKSQEHQNVAKCSQKQQQRSTAVESGQRWPKVAKRSSTVNKRGRKSPKVGKVANSGQRWAKKANSDLKRLKGSRKGPKAANISQKWAKVAKALSFKIWKHWDFCWRDWA
eukprot:EG_transcript_31346